MRTFFTLCWAALLAGAGACSDPAPQSAGIIPEPRAVEWLPGSFRMPATLTYTADLVPADLADLQHWMEQSGREFAPAEAGTSAGLQLRVDPLIEAEGYRLEVDGRGIRLAAADAAGAFYGLQSLEQMAVHFGDEIPAVRIDDAPRFAYRGLMLDVSRHFRDKEFVKKQLDMMARLKLNRFHWHLTDGAGWRIRIDRYPELTDIAAWRPYPDWQHWHAGGRRYCRFDDPGAQGGYYTKEEIREVVEYARRLHITVIPEIEMPGHSEEVLAVYPELACSGKPYTSSDYCIGNPGTFEFLTNVLDEVIALFPSEYIHIGGDEAGKGAWRTCPRCQSLMRREGMKDVDELQSYLVHRIEEYLNSRGRKLLGWDEILEGGLAPNATVMSWRGVEGGIAAARAGHKAVMSPGSHCYLDFCQDDPSIEPPAASAFLDLPTVYSYDPAPDSLGQAVTAMILGVQGNLWCEHVPTEEHCEHMLWPRGMAIAEVGWSLPGKKNYDDFLSRTLEAVAWMQERGYHPFDQKNAVGPRPESREAVQCLSTGKPVVYRTPYHEKYAAAGDATMTDGLRGGWNYGDGRWMGWLASDVDVVVDLGQKQPVGYIGADFVQGYHAYIWMPREVAFAVSDDGERFETVGTTANDLPEEYARTAFRTFSWSGTAEGRYIRLTARANDREGGWLFCDEVIVR